MSNKSAEVQLEPYVLKPLTVPTRLINLGFARFELPASILGEPWQVGDNLFIVFGAGDGLFFGPPISESDEAMVSALESISVLTDAKVDSLFELKKRALAARPFTVWSLPILGKRKAALGATLITLKSLFAFDAPVVRVIETSELGIFVALTPRHTVIAIYDKRKRISQELFIPPEAIDIDQVMAALIASYRFTSHETTRDGWIAEMKAAGIQSRPEAASDTSQLDEEKRLTQVADEVRQRRAARQPTAK